MTAQVNYFSLLIPIFLMVIAGILFVLAFLNKISNYMKWFAAAIFVSVCVQILQTIILPTDIYRFAPLNCFLFFISVLCTAHAVYLRLGIATHWRFVLTTLVISELILTYYCWVEPNLDVRLSIVAICSVLLCCNNLVDLVQSKSSHFLDTLLKISLYGMIFAIVLRAVYMVLIYNQISWIEQRDLIWALTQFLMLFFAIVMITIFISCSIQDTLIRLSRERNLDPLTGLINRRALDEHIERLKLENGHKQHAIILCDIDHFKRVNDQYGHAVGDAALKHIAQMMNKAVRKSDEIARIGGEEFLILLHDVHEGFALTVAERIRTVVEMTPLQIEQQNIYMTVSFGVSFFNHYDDIAQAKQNADLLLYQAKKFGRNKVQWQLQS